MDDIKEWLNGIVGMAGLIMHKILSYPISHFKLLLLLLSIVAVFFQLIHSLYKFYKWTAGYFEGKRND